MKTAFISGANKGLGLETARQLGKLGYTILIGSRDSRRGESARNSLAADGIDAHVIPLDMSDPDSIEAAVDQIVVKLDHLDVLINNAGVNLEMGLKASEVSPEIVRETFEINFFASVDLTQRLLPLLRKSPAARIVNVSSILGSLKLNADPKSPLGDWRLLGYNASKAALNAFTAILSVELAGSPIKVNSAHPGWVKTDLGGENASLGLAEGVETMVWLATLPEDGPTGGFFHKHDPLPW